LSIKFTICKIQGSNPTISALPNGDFRGEIYLPLAMGVTIGKEQIGEDQWSLWTTVFPQGRKRYSGKFMVRIPPEVHRKLATQAAEAGISLNRLASSKLSQ